MPPVVWCICRTNKKHLYKRTIFQKVSIHLKTTPLRRELSIQHVIHNGNGLYFSPAQLSWLALNLLGDITYMGQARTSIKCRDLCLAVTASPDSSI